MEGSALRFFLLDSIGHRLILGNLLQGRDVKYTDADWGALHIGIYK